MAENIEGKKDTRGRKALKINYAKVKKLAALGLTQVEIALALGHGKTAFFKHKKINAKIDEAIEEGRASFKVITSKALVKQMRAGNVSAAIWLEKTRCGIREDGPFGEDEDRNAKPVKVVIEVVDASRDKSTGEQAAGSIPGDAS